MSDGLTARARRYGSSDGVGTAVDMASWRCDFVHYNNPNIGMQENREKLLQNVTHSVTIEEAQIKN